MIKGIRLMRLSHHPLSPRNKGGLSTRSASARGSSNVPAIIDENTKENALRRRAMVLVLLLGYMHTLCTDTPLRISFDHIPPYPGYTFPVG